MPKLFSRYDVLVKNQKLIFSPVYSLIGSLYLFTCFVVDPLAKAVLLKVRRAEQAERVIISMIIIIINDDEDDDLDDDDDDNLNDDDE